MVNRFQGPVDEDPSTILSNTNNLLSIIGISTKKVTSMGELVKVASSMFVAVFESLFHVRLEGIIRNPQSRDEYAHNAQRVIDRFQMSVTCACYCLRLCVSATLMTSMTLFPQILSLLKSFGTDSDGLAAHQWRSYRPRQYERPIKSSPHIHKNCHND